jgi:hypothetical protein
MPKTQRTYNLSRALPEQIEFPPNKIGHEISEVMPNPSLEIGKEVRGNVEVRSYDLDSDGTVDAWVESMLDSGSPSGYSFRMVSSAAKGEEHVFYAHGDGRIYSSNEKTSAGSSTAYDENGDGRVDEIKSTPPPGYRPEGFDPSWNMPAIIDSRSWIDTDFDGQVDTERIASAEGFWRVIEE